MKNLSSELKVGIFAIIVILILSFMTLKVGVLSSLWEKGYRLYVVFDNISGLDENSRIKIAGVDSGIVERITLKDGRAELTLLIQPDKNIYENATAALRMTGLLGDKYLALTTGTSDSPLLKEGGRIVRIDPSADMDVLATELTSAGEYVGDLAQALGDILDEPERRAVSETIHNLRDISEDLKIILAENKAPLHEIVANLEEFSRVLGEKGPGLVASLERIASRLDESAPGLIDDLQKVASNLEEVIAENRSIVRESVENIRNLSESASVIAERLEHGEGTLGKLLKEEGLYESLNKIADGAGRAVEVADRLRTYMDFRADYNVQQSDWRGYFDLILQPRSDRSGLEKLDRDISGKAALN